MKFVIACHAPWDQLCCYFYRAVLPVCVIHNRKYIYYQMTDFEAEYAFCKDNRLVLIGECLFAKASNANAGAELLKLRPLLREQQLICINVTLKITAFWLIP